MNTPVNNKTQYNMSASSGAQAQVALRGPQDILTMSPREESFFRAVYSRHTNHASAEAEQACNNTPAFGRRNIQTTISRSGDLLSQMYVVCELGRIVYNTPAQFNLTTGVYTAWANGIGFAMIDELVCMIGQHDFDTQDGKYMFMRESVAAKSDRKLADEVGLFETPEEAAVASLIPRVMHIPLQFWFNNWLEQSLPMIGLYWHEMRMDLNLKTGAELLFNGFGGAPGAGTVIPANFDDLHYLCNFQYLDRPERALFANQKLEQIFIQVQFLGEETYLATDLAKQVNIRYNHPVTDLMWAFQSDAAKASHDWFNFAGAHFTPLAPIGGLNSAGALDAPPYQEAQIFLNNHQRTIQLPVEYFSNIPAQRTHNRIPRGTFIGTYAFGVEPDGLLHSGSVNFSRMDSAHIRFTLWPSIVPAYSWIPSSNPAATLSWAHAGTISIYARNFNLGKVSIGMMGVKFAA